MSTICQECFSHYEAVRMASMTEYKRRPRVLFFNRSYWPDVESTGQLLAELTHDLATDFDVEVIAGQPNLVNPGNGCQKKDVPCVDEVKIRRLKHTRLRKHSFCGRLVNLLSFTWAAAWTSVFLPRADLVVTQTDPFFLALVGRWLQWRHHSRFIVYLQDIYPDIAIAVGRIREGLVSRFTRWLLFSIYRKADCIVVLSSDMRRTCLDYGIPAAKVRIIANWADTQRIKPEKQHNVFRRDHRLDDKFVVMYSGNLGLAHPLEPILGAAEILKSETQIQFVFVGDGARRDALQADSQMRQLRNVTFLPYQPYECLSQSLSAADVHLVTLQPEATGLLMPSKIYGILASSTAVIVLAKPDCELSQLVLKNDVGMTCDLQSAGDVAERLAFAIRDLASQPNKVRAYGENARKLAETQFDRTLQTKKFGSLLNEFVNTNASDFGTIPLSEPLKV